MQSKILYSEKSSKTSLKSIDTLLEDNRSILKTSKGKSKKLKLHRLRILMES